MRCTWHLFWSLSTASLFRLVLCMCVCMFAFNGKSFKCHNAWTTFWYFTIKINSLPSFPSTEMLFILGNWKFCSDKATKTATHLFHHHHPHISSFPFFYCMMLMKVVRRALFNNFFGKLNGFLLILFRVHVSS